jgi:hypothetical protein
MLVTKLQSGRAVANRAPQIVTIPAGLIIPNACNENGEMLESSIPSSGDVEFDLSTFAKTSEWRLPAALDGDKSECDQ